MPLYIYDKNGLAGLAVPIVAYNLITKEKIGEYESASAAAKKLYIRSPTNILAYIKGTNGVTFKGKRTGVKSYKSDIKYHFEIKQTNANPIQNT